MLQNVKQEISNRVAKSAAPNFPKNYLYLKAFAAFKLEKLKLNSHISYAAKKFDQRFNEAVGDNRFVSDLMIIERKGGKQVFKTRDGRVFEAFNLSNNSYNDLDSLTESREKLVEFVKSEELSSCLSRRIAGKQKIHKELEDELCQFLGFEGCVLATSGYIAQQSMITALFQKGDVIFSDQHNHSSIVDGIKLSGAKVIVYPHLDYDKLEKLLQKHRGNYNNAGIISDGVFSAHGTVGNVDKINELKKEYKAISMIDDTHGFLTVGEKGRGVIDLYKTAPDVLSSSMAKGLAGFGGAILANDVIYQVLDCFGRQNINTSHLSPLCAAQSLFNLRSYLNRPELNAELKEKITHFRDELKKRGMESYKGDFVHPIFSFENKSEELVINFCNKLFEEGFVCAFFPPPVAPNPTLRFSLHRAIPKEELTRLAELLSQSGLKSLCSEFGN